MIGSKQALESPNDRTVLVFVDYDDTLLPSTDIIRNALTESKEDEVSFEIDQEELQAVESACIDFFDSLLQFNNQPGIKMVVKVVSNGDPCWLNSSLEQLLPNLQSYFHLNQIALISSRELYEATSPKNPAKWKHLKIGRAHV